MSTMKNSTTHFIMDYLGNHLDCHDLAPTSYIMIFQIVIIVKIVKMLRMYLFKLCTYSSRSRGTRILNKTWFCCWLCYYCSNVCFHVKSSGFLKSIQGQTCHGCINHDAVGLCYELHFLLHISIEHTEKSFLTLAGIEPRTPQSWVICLYRSIKAFTCFCVQRFN